MIEYVADGTHKVHVVPMLPVHDVCVTPQERCVALLESANPEPSSKAIALSLSVRTRTRTIRGGWLTILCHGRWGRVHPRRRRAVLGQLASHIHGRGEV
jgi:hypothetical protein